MFNTRWLNDLIGRFCGIVVGVSMCTYRVVHRLHHNHLYEAQDPDIPLHGGYPRGRVYLLKKLARDLLGCTAWKTYAYFFGAPAINDAVVIAFGSGLPTNILVAEGNYEEEVLLLGGIHLYGAYQRI